MPRHFWTLEKNAWSFGPSVWIHTFILCLIKLIIFKMMLTTSYTKCWWNKWLWTITLGLMQGLINGLFFWLWSATDYMILKPTWFKTLAWLHSLFCKGSPHFGRFSVSGITKQGEHTMHQYTKIRGPLFCTIFGFWSYKIRGPYCTCSFLVFLNLLGKKCWTLNFCWLNPNIKRKSSHAEICEEIRYIVKNSWEYQEWESELTRKCKKSLKK